MASKNYGKLLLEFVDSLGVPYFYEPSFKLTAGSLLSDRYLLILYLPALKMGKQQLIYRLASLLNMPTAYRDVISEQVLGVRELLIGFDGQGDTSVCKFYVENKIRSVGSETQQAFKAFKWQLDSPNVRMIDHYYLPPVTSRADILSGIKRLSGGRETQGLNAVKALFSLSAELTLTELFYMEVEGQTDEGPDAQGRSSYDLRFYDAEIELHKVMPVITSIATYFAVPETAIEQLLAADKNKHFGHLSSGIGRDGKEFVTFYYGVQAA